MRRPRLLDLFCCAGGAGMGYHRAGFDVVGVDCEPQPRYPFRFVQADALDYLAAHGSDFDVIHASPPCQKNVKGLAAVNRALGRQLDHPDLIEPTRALLHALGKPYIMENVMGAPLRGAVRLCGTSFGLPIYRHRLFECSELVMVPACEHDRQREAKYWTSWMPGGERRRAKVVQVYDAAGERHEWGPALGIDWMTPAELTQAIPPAYTEHLGQQYLAALGLEVAA